MVTGQSPSILERKISPNVNPFSILWFLIILFSSDVVLSIVEQDVMQKNTNNDILNSFNIIQNCMINC